jgi:AcrR family transcriptional regulator
MTEARIDRRVLRTRKLLHMSLAGLLSRKAYDAISVEQICAEAGIGRSTFYAHFIDKDDLKRHALDKLRNALAEESQGARAAGANRPFAFCEAFFAHAADHLPQVCARAGDNRAATSLARVRDILTAQVRAELLSVGAADGDAPSVLSARVAYIVGGLMSLFEWWLDDGAKRPPEEMAALFRQFATGGRSGH